MIGEINLKNDCIHVELHDGTTLVFSALHSNYEDCVNLRMKKISAGGDIVDYFVTEVYVGYDDRTAEFVDKIEREGKERRKRNEQQK